MENNSKLNQNDGKKVIWKTFSFRKWKKIRFFSLLPNYCCLFGKIADVLAHTKRSEKEELCLRLHSGWIWFVFAWLPFHISSQIYSVNQKYLQDSWLLAHTYTLSRSNKTRLFQNINKYLFIFMFCAPGFLQFCLLYTFTF